MRAAGLQAHKKAKRRITTDSAHPFPRYLNLVEQLEIVRPEQVWVCDITYIRLWEEFMYLAVLTDVFTRCIRDWHLSRHLDQSLTVWALEQALSQHTREIHHSDQGVQYAATAYTTRLQEVGVQISMQKSGQPDKMAMLIGSCALSNRRKSTYPNTWIMSMRSAI